MNIVVLNECFLNEDHVERLEDLGNVTIYTDTDTEEKTVNRVKDADIIIVDPFVAPLTKKVYLAANHLKFISQTATGGEKIDFDNANKKGIKVGNIPDYSTQAVAEQAIGLMFAVCRMIPLGDKAMRKAPFEVDAGNPEHTMFKGIELHGKTLGVIGLGKIGTRVAELGHALGMNVMAYNRSQKNLPHVKQVSLEELLKKSDIVSLHLRYDKQLEQFIGEKELSLMKSTAILINTAFGTIIDELALFNALNNHTIYAAGIDLMDNLSADNPLFQLDNIVFTPHEAYLTDGSAQNMAEMVVQNTEAFVKGQPINLLN